MPPALLLEGLEGFLSRDAIEFYDSERDARGDGGASNMLKSFGVVSLNNSSSTDSE